MFILPESLQYKFTMTDEVLADPANPIASGNANAVTAGELSAQRHRVQQELEGRHC